MISQFIKKLYKRTDYTPWILWGIVSLPICFLGVGTDPASLKIIETVQRWSATGVYIPSRHPGFPIYELINTGIYAIFGQIGMTIATLIISIFTLIMVQKIVIFLKHPHPKLITAGMALNPIFWVNATSVMDYNWAILGVSIALYAWLKGHRIWLVIGTAFAIGCRITSGVFPLVMIAYHLIQWLRNSPKIGRQKSHLITIAYASIGGILGLSTYALSWVSAEKSLAFLTPDTVANLGNWTIWGYISRFIYKNIYFWGIATILYFLYLVVLKFKQYPKVSAIKTLYNTPILMISIGIVIAIQVLYFILPYENEYLLMLLPFEACLMAYSPYSRRHIIILLITIASYSGISINIAKPDIPSQASDARLGLFIEKGYLLSDIEKRLKGH